MFDSWYPTRYVFDEVIRLLWVEMAEFSLSQEMFNYLNYIIGMTL